MENRRKERGKIFLKCLQPQRPEKITDSSISTYTLQTIPVCLLKRVSWPPAWSEVTSGAALQERACLGKGRLPGGSQREGQTLGWASDREVWHSPSSEDLNPQPGQGSGCCSVPECVPLSATPGTAAHPVPVLHYLAEFAQIPVHQVGDAIQPSHPLLALSFGFQSLPASGSFPISRLFT